MAIEAGIACSGVGVGTTGVFVGAGKDVAFRVGEGAGRGVRVEVKATGRRVGTGVAVATTSGVLVEVGNTRGSALAATHAPRMSALNSTVIHLNQGRISMWPTAPQDTLPA